MRERLAKVVLWTGFALALAVAIGWVVFIWSLDWGRFGSRSWGLWFFFAFLMGTILVPLPVIFIFGWLSTLINPGSTGSTR
jgi:hypothetical protein